MRKYAIMGPQGSGKGTQARLLKDDYDLVHISVGDIFRWNIQAHTKLAARIKRIVDAGQLVSDDIVAEIIAHRLQEHDWNYGFILDGFPRNGTQAEFFLENYDIDAVIHINIPDEEVFARTLSRRLCSQCGLDYNLIFHRPAKDDVCDVCGGKLITRTDDTEQGVRSRLKDYREKTQPVLDLFRRKELVIDIDGTLGRDKVAVEIRAKCKLPAITSKSKPSTATVPARA
jgi:adenylate kinase